MVKLADTPDLGSGAVRCGGSSPPSRTNSIDQKTLRPFYVLPKERNDITLLPDIHLDPFDRILIAQTRHHHFLLVTQDNEIQKYEAEIMNFQAKLGGNRGLFIGRGRI